VNSFDELYVKNPLNFKVSLLPQVREILDKLNHENIKTAIVTTKDRYRTEKILNNLKLHFDAIITCDDTSENAQIQLQLIWL